MLVQPYALMFKILTHDKLQSNSERIITHLYPPIITVSPTLSYRHHTIVMSPIVVDSFRKITYQLIVTSCVGRWRSGSSFYPAEGAHMTDTTRTVLTKKRTPSGADDWPAAVINHREINAVAISRHNNWIINGELGGKLVCP